MAQLVSYNTVSTVFESATSYEVVDVFIIESVNGVLTTKMSTEEWWAFGPATSIPSSAETSHSSLTVPSTSIGSMSFLTPLSTSAGGDPIPVTHPQTES